MLLKGQLYLLSGPLQKESTDHWARGWPCREKWTGLPYTSSPSLFTDSILNSTTRENLFVIPQTVVRGRSQSLPATPEAPVPRGGRTRPCSAFWVVLYDRQVILSTVLLAPCCLHFCVCGFCWGFKMTLKHSAEGLSSVFQCKKAMIYPTEKILVLVSFIQARANSPTAC